MSEFNQFNTSANQTQDIPSIVSEIFGIVIPGRPIITNFKYIGDGKLITQVEYPSQIQQFAATLFKPSLPDGCDAGIYYIQPDAQWNYIGKISHSSPTAFFRASWDDQVLQNYPFILIGILMAPSTTFNNLVTADQISEVRTFDSARAIATDLYTYITSFSVIPNDVIDRWMKRFEEKHRRQPFFWLENKPLV